ncbi:hypothetical protein SAMN02745823_00578 [Sporobacter termitidis DSM 10068]|uniref:Uncharacterized protein n=1 Tax=Sporobacter termitidis DSM 10068 TaxID=1123282 RepID=A0A1M5UME8_9FIRM|nr:hypothetical protein [Sporobacter termitidis]SHH63873.1 hypothetical protein SAMN02745823_00578 [Sporobacter termitidis DSM 10068]
MICLIGAEETARAGWWRRLRRAAAHDKGFSAGDEVVLGVRMLRAVIESSPGMKPEALRKRIKNAAEWMRARRVRQVIFAKNFPYRALVLREGFDEMDGGALWEALAGRIAARFGGDSHCAALFAGRLTMAVLRTLTELCASFKYLMVTTETGSGREFDALRRRTGVSVIEQPTDRQLSRADVAVIFGPQKRLVVLPPECVALGVGAGALEGVLFGRAVSELTLGLTDERESELPSGFPRDVLFSAALNAGTLQPEDIVIQDVRLTAGPRRDS